MRRYGNLRGGSGVEAYEIGAGFIAVRFRPGVVYWYTAASGERRRGASRCIKTNGPMEIHRAVVRQSCRQASLLVLTVQLIGNTAAVTGKPRIDQ